MSGLLRCTIAGLAVAALAILGTPAARAETPAPNATPRATRLVIQPLAPVGVGEKPRIVVRLTLATGEVAGAVENEALQLLIDGQPTRRVRTGASGQATIPVRGDLTVGQHRVEVVYDGSRSLGPSRASATLTIQPATLVIQIIPALPGVQFSVDGQTVTSDASGVVRFDLDRAGKHHIELVTTEIRDDEMWATFSRWRDEVFTPERDVDLPIREPLQIGFDVKYRVSWSYVDLDGQTVDPARVESITIKGTHGVVHQIRDDEPIWLLATRIVRLRSSLEEAKIQWGVESVMIDGANVVNQGQHRFFVNRGDNWSISLLLYAARISARDALFGFPLGSGFTLQSPDNQIRAVDGGPNQQVTVPGLARGHYVVAVSGAPGYAPPVPVAITREQDVQLKVISYFDLGVGAVLFGSIGLGLLFLGRPQILRRIPRPLRRTRRLGGEWVTALLLFIVLAVPVLGLSYIMTFHRAAPSSGTGMEGVVSLVGPGWDGPR